MVFANLLPLLPVSPPFIFLTKLPLFQLLLLLLPFSNSEHQQLSQFSLFSPSSSAMGQLIGSQQQHKLVEKAEQPIMANSTGPIVPTSHGQIRGKTLVFEEWGQMDAFFAIPYAKPPVAELRFEKTRPLEPWEGIRDALELPPMAIPWVRPANWAESAEVRAQYSEDCLYLNLFRPHPPDAEGNDDDGNGGSSKEEKPQLLPVLAIIPGGGFQKGSARRYGNLEEIGRKYLRRGILVAVIQSRIGIFGFASSGTAEFAGNLGYWDQREAIRWLQANLAAFGGDPARITLFGYSSGSTSVSSLAVSPHSQDLFAQSIQMSGSVMMCRAASEKVVEETRKLAKAIGGNEVPMAMANGTNGKEDTMKEWLKTKTLEDFFDGIDKIGSTRADLNYVKFGPRLDGDFLPSDFGELIAKAKPKPTIIGLTEMEPLANVLFGKNSSLHWDAIPWAQFATFGPSEFEEYIRQRVITAEEFPVPARREAFIGDVMDFYLANLTVYDGHRAYLEQLMQVMADLQFIVPFAWEVEARAKAAAAVNGTQNANATTTTNLFAYMNKYANARWFPPEVWLHRPFHDSDHPYVFRNPAPDDYKFDAEDEQIEGHLNEFMANFVKTGNPSTAEIRWDPAPAKSTEGPLNGHMLIQMPQPEMSHGFEAQKRVDFWNRMTAKYSEYNLVLGRKGGDAHGNGKEDGEDQQQNGNGTSGTTLMGLSKNAIGMALLFLLLLMGQFTALLM